MIVTLLLTTGVFAQNWRDKYDWVSYFSEGLASVRLNGKWDFIDRTGKIVIPFKYDSVGEFRNGMTAATRKGKVFFIDMKGNKIKK